jgi:hypothetical protein
MARNIAYIALGTIVLLMVPLIGDWPWSLSDFVLGGTLIFLAGLAYELISRFVPKRRLIVGVIVLIVFLLVWAELAVGLFGTPFAGS